MGRHATADSEKLATSAVKRPLYARLLRLRHIAPGGLACFVLLEGSAGVGMILALAGLTSWWALAVLPISVALMVILNDAVAGRLEEVVDSTRRRAAR
jgi:hypothetical protein